MYIERAILNAFFDEWQNRDIQKIMLRDASDNTLANMLIVTSDIRAVILAEYDKRGPKQAAS